MGELKVEMRPAPRRAKWNDFAEGVTEFVTFEDKLHFFYIVLLQFIVVDAVYIRVRSCGKGCV